MKNFSPGYTPKLFENTYYYHKNPCRYCQANPTNGVEVILSDLFVYECRKNVLREGQWDSWVLAGKVAKDI
jgi:hypothetical protein